MSEGQLTFKIIASVTDEVLEHRPRWMRLHAADLLFREGELMLWRRLGLRAFGRSCGHRGANEWTTKSWAGIRSQEWEDRVFNTYINWLCHGAHASRSSKWDSERAALHQKPA